VHCAFRVHHLRVQGTGGEHDDEDAWCIVWSLGQYASRLACHAQVDAEHPSATLRATAPCPHITQVTWLRCTNSVAYNTVPPDVRLWHSVYGEKEIATPLQLQGRRIVAARRSAGQRGIDS
jgi:hypothetical protein